MVGLKFERIPEAFAAQHQDAIAAWVKNFEVHEHPCGLRLRGAWVVDVVGLKPDYVVLTGEMRRGRMVVSPASERDERVIREHVEGML